MPLIEVVGVFVTEICLLTEMPILVRAEKHVCVGVFRYRCLVCYI